MTRDEVGSWVLRGVAGLLLTILAYLAMEVRGDARILQAQVVEQDKALELLRQDLGYIKVSLVRIENYLQRKGVP